ncbi:MAG: methylenetetrahydrofolate reductase [Chloroflexota bacterium]
MGRTTALDPRARSAIRDLLADPVFELIPLRNLDAQADALPDRAAVSVTASAARGIEATVAASERLAERGFRVTPHLSARLIRDRDHLRALLDRLVAARISRVFVIGGDADEPGAFPDALSLLRAIGETGVRFDEVGIAAYPEGHPDIPAARLLEALAAKQPFATSMTTQLCFDPEAIRRWLRARRDDGITLPVVIGLPGVAELRKLLSISARIGVADSRRFLRKNTRLVGRLVRPGGFDPDALLAGLAPLVVDPALGIRGVHLYTFNQAEATADWLRAYRDALGVPAGVAS